MTYATAAFTEAELVQILNELKAELTASRSGQRYVSLSTGGKSFSRLVRKYDEIQRELGDVIVALQAKNPTEWGNPTNTTHTDFSTWQMK